MTESQKRGLTLAVSVAVIALCSVWVYRTQFRTARHNVALHKHIGKVLAEETANLAGNRGKVVTIAIELKEWPELETQLDSFNETLRRLGSFEVREYLLDTRDQPKYGVGSGLSGRRYVRTVNKNPGEVIFVSFVGAPSLTKEDVAALSRVPKLIVESRSPDNVGRLFVQKLVTVAVVPRFQFPSPGGDNPRTGAAMFDKNYQIVTPDNAAAMPQPKPGDGK